MITDIVRGLIGVIFLIGVCYLFSSNRKAIDWPLVIKGLLIQLTLALLILKVPYVDVFFSYVAKFFTGVLNFTEAGASFLFGSWPDQAFITDEGNNVFRVGYIFAFKVLPTILFFSALTSVLYFLGILQIIVYAFAWVMKKVLHISGAESLAAAANIFIGQTEAPLVVKPYIDKMNRSEVMCLMTGGMATIAGSVFAAFVGFLGGGDPVQEEFFAKHLLTASIMSAPAAIIAAKILIPRGDLPIDSNLKIARQEAGSNILDAISKGTTDGIKLAVNVGAMLLVFIAFMAMCNKGFELIGEIGTINEWVSEQTNGKFKTLSLQYIFSILFAPVAWLIGVPKADVMLVGQLLGEKTIINEFIAYLSLNDFKNANAFANPKSIIIATYALCGFANFSSIGIQIGGISAIAPSQRGTLTQLGFQSLIGGTIACFLTATIAGMLI